MLIALDFDETVTLDPSFWGGFIRLAEQRGYEVIVVTYRFDSSTLNADIEEFCMENNIQFYCTGGEAKRIFMEKEGIYPSVWIDDNPWTICN